MSLSPDAVMEIEDVAMLQDICVTLMKIREKDAGARNKAKSVAKAQQMEISSKNMEIQCLKEKVLALQTIISETGDSQPKNSSENAAKEAGNSATEGEVCSLRKELEKSKTEIANLRKENSILKETPQNDTVEQYEIAIQRLNRQLLEMEESSVNVQEAIKNKARQEFARLQGEIDVREQKIEFLVKSKEQHTNESSPSSEEVEALKRNLIEKQKEIEMITNKNSEITNSFEALTQEKEGLAADVKRMQEESFHYKNSIKEITKKYEDMTQQLKEQEQRNEEKTNKDNHSNLMDKQRYAELEKTNNQMKKEIELLNTELENYKKEAKQKELQMQELIKTLKKNEQSLTSAKNAGHQAEIEKAAFLEQIELLKKEIAINKCLKTEQNDMQTALVEKEKAILESEKLQVLLKQKDAKIAEIEKTLSQNEKILLEEQKVTQKQHADLEQQLSKLQELTMKITSITQSNEQKDIMIKQLKGEKQTLEIEKGNIEAQNKEKEQQIESLQLKISCFEDSQKGENEKDQLINSLQSKHSEMQVKFDELQKQFNSKQEEIIALETNIKEKNEMIEQLTKDKTAFESQILALNEQMKVTIQENISKIENINKENENNLKLEADKNIELEKINKEQAGKITKLLKDIETVNIEKKTLITITENNKAKAKERIKQLKQSLRESIETHNTEVGEVEEEREGFLTEIGEHKEKIKQLNEEIKSLKTTIATNLVESESRIKMLTNARIELDTMKNLKQDYENLMEELRTARLEITTKNQLLANECSASERLQEALTDKDSTIIKLKETVQFYSKQEQNNKNVIEDLRNESCKLTERLAQLSMNSSSNQADVISKLEMEKIELEQKLQNSQASTDLVNKNRQLSAMMEKLNRLYSMLLDEHQALVKEHERMKPKPNRQFKLQSCTKLTIHASKMKQAAQNEEKNVTMAYLRRTLLQFFTEEQTNRGSMIPLILDLAGCSKEQISVATSEYERSQQLLSRTSRFFFK